MATLGINLLWRVRAAKRFNAAVDAYAKREIDRQRHSNGAKMGRDVLTCGAAMSREATHDW
jgi:hypothetical protein